MKLANKRPIINTLLRSHRKALDSVTFFITSACNLRCKYCFNASSLGKKDDLTFEEIKKIFDNLPHLRSLILSGGEPYIRPDFYDIVDYFVNVKKIKSIGIPSNCVDSKRTLTKTEHIIKNHPNTIFVLCASLDTTEELHNELRGLNTHKLVVATVKKLAKLAEKYPNLRVLVNTVVTKDAVPHLQEFIEFIYTIGPTLHSLDIVRTFTKKDKKAFADFTTEDYAEILRARLQLDDMYRKGDILLPIYKLRTNILTETQKNVISHDAKWATPCLAGLTSLVIDANGDMRICENKKPLGNLRKYQYDYKKLLNTTDAKKTIGDIAQHKCDCNHIVTMRESIETHFPSALVKYMLHR